MILWTIFPLIFYELNSVWAKVMAPIILPHHIHFINSYPFRFKAHFIFPFSFWLGIPVYGGWWKGGSGRKGNEINSYKYAFHRIHCYHSLLVENQRLHIDPANGTGKKQHRQTSNHMNIYSSLAQPLRVSFQSKPAKPILPRFPKPLLLIYKII